LMLHLLHGFSNSKAMGLMTSHKMFWFRSKCLS